MARASELANLGEDGFADSGGVKIHYVTKGTGPLVILPEAARNRSLLVGQPAASISPSYSSACPTIHCPFTPSRLTKSRRPVPESG
jgi:hypothetical protein